MARSLSIQRIQSEMETENPSAMRKKSEINTPRRALGDLSKNVVNFGSMDAVRTPFKTKTPQLASLSRATMPTIVFEDEKCCSVKKSAEDSNKLTKKESEKLDDWDDYPPIESCGNPENGEDNDYLPLRRDMTVLEEEGPTEMQEYHSLDDEYEEENLFAIRRLTQKMSLKQQNFEDSLDMPTLLGTHSLSDLAINESDDIDDWDEYPPVESCNCGDDHDHDSDDEYLSYLPRREFTILRDEDDDHEDALKKWFAPILHADVVKKEEEKDWMKEESVSGDIDENADDDFDENDHTLGWEDMDYSDAE